MNGTDPAANYNVPHTFFQLAGQSLTSFFASLAAGQGFYIFLLSPIQSRSLLFVSLVWNWNYDDPTNIISLFYIWLAPFQTPSSDNLGNPVINYTTPEEGTARVPLICEVPLLNGIEKWRNLTYRIEWFANGSSLRIEERCGGNFPAGKEHNESCPNTTSIHSRLPGNYSIGQWVSKAVRITL